MGLFLLDYAHVGEGAIVAAGALVLSNTIIPPYTLWAGVPAKFVKNVEPEKNEWNEPENCIIMQCTRDSSMG